MTVRAMAEEVALRTRWLVFARPMPVHAAALFPLLNDWDVVRMLSEVPWPLHYEDVEGFLSAQPCQATDDFVLIADAGPVGVASIKKPGSGDPPRKMPRLGYWIGHRFWGQGFGAEAIGALVDRAFRSCASDVVGAGVFADNPASRHVLEKLGFSETGRCMTHSASRGSEVETVDMQVTRIVWAGAPVRR